MTAPEPQTEAARTIEEVQPATGLAEPQAGHADSSDSGTGPSTAHNESSVPGDEWSAAGADAGRHTQVESSSSSQTQPADNSPSAARTESAPAGTDSPAVAADATRSGTESSPERALFADDELAGLRARWETVQVGFVDDPQGCVQKADGLVSDVVEQLTNGFAQTRSRLEDQWSRGEEASTEDLRIALKRYRDFFERLLAV